MYRKIVHHFDESAPRFVHHNVRDRLLTVQDGLGLVGEEGDVAARYVRSRSLREAVNVLEGGDDLAILFDENSVFYITGSATTLRLTDKMSYPKCWEPNRKDHQHLSTQLEHDRHTPTILVV